jgi:4-hydroxy-3-polyprenylbenzoate decarboxylase
MKKKKIVIAVTGASGSVYAQLLLNKLKMLTSQVESCALIVSVNGEAVWQYELGSPFPDEPFYSRYPADDLFAPPASGSAGFDTMVIIPCSMGTMGRIAGGMSDDLITRAADVILKERKQLILVPREMPYNLIHIRNMETLTLAGAVVIPASPSFYSRPANLEDACMTVVDRVLKMAGFEFESYSWGG